MAWCPLCSQWARSLPAAARSLRVSSPVDLCRGMHRLSPESLATIQGRTHCLMKPEECLQRMSTYPAQVRAVVKSLQLPVRSGAPWPQQEGGQGHVSRKIFQNTKPLASYSIQGPHHWRVAVFSSFDFQCHEMAFIREGFSCLTCSTVEWAAVGNLSFLPGVLDTILAGQLWWWEENSLPRDAMSLWCPLSLGRRQRYAIWCGFRNSALRLVMQVHSGGNCGWWVGPLDAAGARRAWLTPHSPRQRFRGKRCCLLFLFLLSSPQGGRLVFSLLCIPHSTSWETSATPLASIPVSVMINSNVVSPALTSSFSKQTR